MYGTFSSIKMASVHHTAALLSTVFGVAWKVEKSPKKRYSAQINVTKELTHTTAGRLI
jgi:hypothetical protein